MTSQMQDRRVNHGCLLAQAYDTWLAIPHGEHPPSPYRLLGLSEGDGDAAVIEAAAQRQLARIGALVTPENIPVIVAILREIDLARAVLLGLRQDRSDSQPFLLGEPRGSLGPQACNPPDQLRDQTAAPVSPTGLGSTTDEPPPLVQVTSRPGGRVRQRRRSRAAGLCRQIVQIVVGGLVGILLSLLILHLLEVGSQTRSQSRRDNCSQKTCVADVNPSLPGKVVEAQLYSDHTIAAATASRVRHHS